MNTSSAVVSSPQLRQELARQRALADLLREGHRLGSELLPAEQILQRMLKVLMGAMGADRGAVLRRGAGQTVELRLVIGMDGELLSRTPVPARIGSFHRLGFRKLTGSADRYLQQVAGEPPVLWHRDELSGIALILGRAADRGSELVSESAEREILEFFFALLEEVRSRRLELRMLRESEERFRGFVENMPDAAFRTDVHGRVNYVNRAARELTGCSDEELIGHRGLELMQEASQRAAMDAMSRVLAGVGQEVELKLNNGVYAQLSLRPLRDRGGTIVGSFGTARDVTRRRHDESFLRTMVENSLQGTAVVQDNRLVYVNPPFAELTAVTVSELSGMRLQDLVERTVHPSDRDMVWSRFQRRVRGDQVRERYRFRFLRADGSSFPILMHACRTVYRGRPAVQVAMIETDELD